VLPYPEFTRNLFYGKWEVDSCNRSTGSGATVNFSKRLKHEVLPKEMFAVSRKTMSMRACQNWPKKQRKNEKRKRKELGIHELGQGLFLSFFLLEFGCSCLNVSIEIVSNLVMIAPKKEDRKSCARLY
jgi:hypothetical protein